MSLVVTPTGHEGWCKSRQDGSPCYCCKARYCQLCQCCKRWIRQDHCIEKGLAGWTHVRCEGEERRGMVSIESGFRRARRGAFLEDDDQRPSARRRLTYDQDETGEDSKESEESSHSEKEDNDQSSSNSTSDSGDFTAQQQKIRSQKPSFDGVPVCVNALAGCGKTTTIAMLCNSFEERYPRYNKLYLVFNKKNQDEAMQSGKFPKQKMEIRTTHAFVLRHYFGVEAMNALSPLDDYDVKDIQDKVKLWEEIRRIFPNANHTSRKFKRKVNSVASYIRKTIHNFQSSNDVRLSEKHIFWRAKKNTNLCARSEWRNLIPVTKYKEWASEYFEIVKQRCHQIRDYGMTVPGISHDGYLKVAQLEQSDASNLLAGFDFVIVDEAQDFTPCQADLFWENPISNRGKAIYLFGDRYQQLYRFRGAGQCFGDMCDETPCRYSLTGSFRFGENIANTASLVLRAMGGEKLHGRAINPGKVHHVADFDGKGTVLCRTNQGIYRHLFFNRPKKWCYLDRSKRSFPTAPSWVYELESFLRGLGDDAGICFGFGLHPGADHEEEDSDEEVSESTGTFRYKDERFTTLVEIESYIDDEGDNELLKYLELMKFLKSENEDFKSFLNTIKASFQPLTCDPDKYDGIVLSTVHKAKGLEFSKVVVSDDFKFNVIEKAIVSEERYCDEANILYVAITRAKEHLFLCQAARYCLDNLAAKLEVATLALHSYASVKQIRDSAETNWESFTTTRPKIESLLDIAWPNSEDTGSLPLDHEMNESDQRKYLRTLLLRYHPDKFFPAFGDLITSNALRNEIQEKLHKILESCRESLRALQAPEE